MTRPVDVLAKLEELRQAVGEDPEGDRAVRQIIDAMAELIAERDRLHALINNPQTEEFLPAVRAEAAHQVQRWGTVHDRAKEPADWFWLVGYLAGKALKSHIEGDITKALHHTISSGAALAHWHAAIKHGAGLMTPGASDLQASLEKTFGSDVGGAS